MVTLFSFLIVFLLVGSFFSVIIGAVAGSTGMVKPTPEQIAKALADMEGR